MIVRKNIKIFGKSVSEEMIEDENTGNNKENNMKVSNKASEGIGGDVSKDVN